MPEYLTQEDYDLLVAMSKKPEEYDLLQPQWFLKIAAKVEATLNRLKELSPPEPVVKKDNWIWQGTLLLKIRGLTKPRFEDMGEIGNNSMDDAKKLVSERAEKFIAEFFKDAEIEWWEVRVRPAQSLKT